MLGWRDASAQALREGARDPVERAPSERLRIAGEKDARGEESESTGMK